MELPEDTRANTTDPESQTLKTRNGWKQGYNGQAMVDYQNQVIVAQDITTDTNDVQQLQPMLQNCRETNGELPNEAAMDAGYWSKYSKTEGLLRRRKSTIFETTSNSKQKT